MKKFSIMLMISVFTVFLMAGSAMAVPLYFGDGGTALQTVLDNITVGPNAGVSSIDVTQDGIADAFDSYWSVTGSGTASTTMIIELAGYANDNVFGIYDDGQYVPLFIGSANAGDTATLTITGDGSIIVVYTDYEGGVWTGMSGGDTGIDFAGNSFGFYLASPDMGGYIFHSDSSLNSDSSDHMYVYQGLGVDTIDLPVTGPGIWTPNEYVLAFEDLLNDGTADNDFTDFVVMVESIHNPVPEPATMMLFGSGLIGFAFIGRKKFFNRG